jgi:hypothetical protein
MYSYPQSRNTLPYVRLVREKVAQEPECKNRSKWYRTTDLLMASLNALCPQQDETR